MSESRDSQATVKDEAASVLRNAPKQRRSAERLERVLEQAERHVARDGFDALTMTAVAESVGMSIGALYRFYPDKQSLGAAVSQRVMNRILDAVSTALSNDPALEAEDLTKRAIGHLAALVTNDRAAISLMAQAADHPGPGQRIHNALREAIAAILSARVPNVPEDELDYATTCIAGIVQNLLVHAGTSVAARRIGIVAEMMYIISAYTTSKYPYPDSIVWQLPGFVPAPHRAAYPRLAESSPPIEV